MFDGLFRRERSAYLMLQIYEFLIKSAYNDLPGSFAAGGVAYADLNYCLFHGLCFHMLTSDMRINHYIW